MKRTVEFKSGRGFSLVELLVVVAVIGLIAAIALPSVSKITDKAKKASAQTNAKTLCNLHRNAKTAGAGFSASTRSGIFEELVVGVTGTIVASDFKMGDLSDDDKSEALKYCSYDATEDMLNYYPEGDAPEDGDGWVLGSFYPSDGFDAWIAGLNSAGGEYEYRTAVNPGNPVSGNTWYDKRRRL